MPAPPIVIDQEFEACSIGNGDGTSVTFFVTVLDAQNRFTMRSVNTGTAAANLTVVKAGGTVIPISVPAGATVLIRQQDNGQTGDWLEVRARFSIQGAAR